MNKCRLPLLSLAALALTSCADTAQLYPQGAFLNGSYVEHVYNLWEGSTKQGHENIVYSKTLQNEKNGFFCGSGSHEKPTECYGYGQARSWHPEYFLNSAGQSLYWGTEPKVSDIMPGAPGAWVDNSELYEVVYSQNKRLDRFYEKFSNGYLSKLYNGQIKCNGWSYYAMAVVSDEGFGTLFPYELKSADYFATSLLVSTDYTPAGKGRVVEANVEFTFYKLAANGLEGYQINLEHLFLSCNAGAYLTSLVGFTFADAGFSPESIVGLSVNWELLNDEAGISSDFSAEGYHDGLSIYEVLFPDSTWY